MRKFLLTAFAITCFFIAGCSSSKAIPYHFADRKESMDCYRSNMDYFNGIGPRDIQYKTQDINGSEAELVVFGAEQMMDFTDDEKKGIDKIMEEIENDLKKNHYTIPHLDEVTFIKSTQKEESGSGAYTHGTQIYIAQEWVDAICSDNVEYHIEGKYMVWHELFHCLTRSNPDFRKKMYSIIGFTVQDKDFELPPSVYEIYISNPDVEHYNAYATFNIDGEMIDCYMVLIATKPFEKEGDSFFDCMEGVLVPTDGSDKYYTIDEASNFWDLFGRNTDYVTDPEECMADNFSFAMTFGKVSREYNNPEIIDAILDEVSK